MKPWREGLAMRDYFNPDWWEYGFGLLFTATWIVCILTFLALVAAACLRSVSARKIIWTACVVGLAIVPFVSLILPHCFLAYRSGIEPLHFPTQWNRPALPGTSSPGEWLSSGAWCSWTVSLTLLSVWAAGAAASLARLLWGWIEMVRLLRQSRPCRDPRVAEILELITERPRSVTVLELKGLVGAICWQIRDAKIVLSADLEHLSVAELEMVMRHECAHLARSDPMMLFVQRLVEIVYWFHPLVWWASLELSKSREFACDDAVVEWKFTPPQYAQCLGRLALWYYAPVPLAPAGLGMLWNQHVVLLRVRRLMVNFQARKTLNRFHRWLLYLAATGTMFGVAVGRVDWNAMGRSGHVQWTAWPSWTATLLDEVGIQVRDFPLDAHRYDPGD